MKNQSEPEYSPEEPIEIEAPEWLPGDPEESEPPPEEPRKWDDEPEPLKTLQAEESISRREPCPICDTRGQVYDINKQVWETCWNCGGSGWVDVEEDLLSEILLIMLNSDDDEVEIEPSDEEAEEEGEVWIIADNPNKEDDE